jgi:hypothetical protein
MCQKKTESIELISKGGNKLPEQVEHYEYLGSIINQDGRCIIKIRTRIAQAKSAFIKNKNLLYINNMSIKIRKRFIKLYAWSVVLYGCETWILNKVEQRTFESFEIWCWRWMLKVSWIEHRTNENILNKID